MFKFDNKGQGSSVFNLLIAALVSLAILGLLFAVLNMVNFNPGNKPSDTAINLVNDASNNQFNVKSQEVTFKKGDSITEKAIKSKNTVGDSISLSLCNDVSNLNLIQSETNSTIQYTGTSSQRNIIYTICGANIVQDDILLPTGTTCTIEQKSEFTCYVLVGPYTG